MEIVISTPGQNSPRQAFGPFDVIKQYYKKDKMPSLIQSDESLEKSNNKQQTVGRYSRNKLQQTFIQRSSLLRQFFKPKFIKLFLQHQLIQKFLSNLFQRAYIFRKNKQYIPENYLSSNHKKKDEKEIHTYYSTSVFQPGSIILIIWDLIGISIIALSLWLCPFLACFLQQGSIESDAFDLQLFKYLVSIIAIYSAVDFLISLNRGFIQKGEMIFNRVLILKHYFQLTFFEEILNLLMWSFFYFEQNVNQFITIFQMLLIFKQIRRKIKNQYEQFYLRGGLNQILDLINVILSVYFVAHTMACFWYYMGYVTTTKFGHSWLLKYNLYEESLWIKYAYSLYWATMTMVTVGYGDITASNHYEIVASIVMMFISSCMFAYSMNSIGYILKVIYDQKLKYKKSLILINQHMSNNHIEQKLQSRVRNYLQHYFQEENNGSQDDVKLTSIFKIDRLYECLPVSLKSELTTDVQMKVIKQIKILQLLSLQTQQHLSQFLELQTYLPGDYIRMADQALYFLYQGTVSVFEQKSNTHLQLLYSGSTFGEFEFFTGFNTKLQVKANTLCKVYRIQRQNILQTLKFNQKDFEKYHHIKDELIFGSNLQLISQRCNFCSEYSHLNINCPNNLYKPDLEKIIKQAYHQQQQCRIRNYTRKRQRSINSVSTQQDLHNCAKLFEEDESQRQGSFDFCKASNTVIESKSDNKHQKLMSQKNLPDGQIPSFQIIEDKHSISQHHQAMLDEFKINKFNQTTEIDQCFSYSIYMPQYNLENNIREYERAIKKYPQSFQLKLRQAGKYTIYQQAKVNSIRMRQLLEKTP